MLKTFSEPLETWGLVVSASVFALVIVGALILVWNVFSLKIPALNTQSTLPSREARPLAALSILALSLAVLSSFTSVWLYLILSVLMFGVVGALLFRRIVITRHSLNRAQMAALMVWTAAFAALAMRSPGDGVDRFSAPTRHYAKFALDVAHFAVTDSPSAGMLVTGLTVRDVEPLSPNLSCRPNHQFEATVRLYGAFAVPIRDMKVFCDGSYEPIS